MKNISRVLKMENTIDLLVSNDSFFLGVQYLLESQFPREPKQHLFLIHHAYRTCWDLTQKSTNKWLGDGDAENLAKGFLEMCLLKEFPPADLVHEVIQFLYKKSEDLKLFSEDPFKNLIGSKNQNI